MEEKKRNPFLAQRDRDRGRGKKATGGEKKKETEGVGKRDDQPAFDFSYLPETVWVNIMRFLPLSDQYHISTTCQMLYGIFNHPCNWKSLHLQIKCGRLTYGRTYYNVTPKFKYIVERFGHCFQQLTICLVGNLVVMEDDTRQILTHLSQVCRLEHLVFDVSLLTSDFHLADHRLFHKDLETVLLFIDTASRLKRIDIVSWPMSSEIFIVEKLNVFEVMKKTPKVNNLESLSLFWQKDIDCSDRNLQILPPDYTTELVSHYHCLQHLSLRSPMLSDQLLQELAGPSYSKLASLEVLLCYFIPHQVFSLPAIQSSTWKALLAKNPDFKVECGLTRINEAEYVRFLQPEIPLVAVQVLTYTLCTPTLLSGLKEKFAKSLKSFVCYADPLDCEKELFSLVQQCQFLDTLVFHGTIHSRRILDIAKLRPNWKKVIFLKRSIVTEPEQYEHPKGTFSLHSRSSEGQQNAEVQREKVLSSLNREMSKRVSYNWRPS